MYTALAESLETELYHNIASQAPKTVWDRWNAWRYLAMLGNPKTIIRNFTGNVAFIPMKALKNEIGAVLEKLTGVKQSERTKL